MARESLGELGVDITADASKLNKFLSNDLQRSLERAGREASAQFQRGMKSAGAKSGRELGTGVKSAFSSSAQGLGDAALQSLNKEVAAAAKSLGAARLKQQDQAGRVRAAEARLAEAVQRSGKESATAIAASERLESARRRQAVADDAVKASSERLAEAKRRVAVAAKDAERAASGMGSTVGAKLSGLASSAGRWGADVGRKFADGLQSAATAGVAAAGAALSVSLVAGFNRLNAIDTARAKLTGLGNDGRQVAAIMADAGASVRGTAFGLGEAATVAASAVAAGIKPGEQLQSHLKNIANNAAAAGIGMDEMGAIFNKAATSASGVQNDVISRLADRGLPIYEKLGEQLGVTAGEVFSMASRGEVDFATFSKAAEEAAGTVADEMGKTVPGALSNMRAALGRIGANIFGGFNEETGEMEGLFARLGPLIMSVTKALGPIEEKARSLGEALDSKLGPILDKVTSFFERLGGEGEEAGGALSNLGAVIGPVGGAFAALGIGGLGPLLAKLPLVGNLLGGLGTKLGMLGGPLGIAAAALAGFMLTGGDAQAFADGITGMVDSVVAAIPGLVQSVVTVVPNIIDAIVSAVPALLEAGVAIVGALIDGIIQALPWIVDGAAQLLSGLLDAVVSNLPAIIEGGISLVMALLEGVLEALPLLIDAALQLVLSLSRAILDNLPAIIQAGIDLLMALIGGVIGAIPMLLGAALEIATSLLEAVVDALPLLIEAGVQLLISLVEGLIGALPQLIEAGISLVIQLVSALLENLPLLIGAAIQLLVALAQGLIQAIPQLLAAIPQIFSALWEALVGVDWLGLGAELIGSLGDALATGAPGLVDFFSDIWDSISGAISWAWENVIKPVVDGIVGFFNTYLKPAFEALWAVVSFVWNAISAAIQIAWGVISYIFGMIVNVVKNVLGAIFTWLYENVIKPVWDGIKRAIETAWGIIKGIFESIKWVINNVLAPPFRWLYDNVIKPVWDGIKRSIQTVGDWFKNTIAPIFKNVTEGIGKGFETMRDAIKNVWDKVTEIAKAPVRFIVYTVYRDGIKKTFDDIAEAVGLDTRMPAAPSLGFARGGILPGYTPGADIHKFYSPTAGWLHLSGGEGIIRPDALRALGGKAWLDQINRYRGRGGAGAFAAGGVVPPVQRFAEGGVFGWVGNTFDAVTGFLSDAASAVGQILSDPLGAIKNLILTPVENLLQSMGGSGFLVDALVALPRKVIDWIGSFFESEAPKATNVEFQGYRGGATLARLIPIIQKYGLVVTDTYGSPSYNASLGRVPTSYHGDFANPAVDIAGPFSAMEQAANEIIAMGGWRQILWKVAGHWDHIHVANRGGVFGDLPARRLYDSGGWLRPGTTVVTNASGRPEPVLTSDQWKLIERLVEQNADRGPGTIVEEGAVQVIGTLDPRRAAIEAVDRIVEKIGG